MEGSHRLKELLQVQLASDSYAVLHLPFVLETLTKEDFAPSAHTQKWIARVNSLIHAKDPAAKWSGLCLAFHTATFSRDLMLECAQSWVGAAMPLLVNQPPPTTKAAIRLLRLIFSSAMDVPEFQRQLCVPNVPKFVGALVTIAENEGGQDSLPLVFETLTHIVSLYPSLCRPLHGSLSKIALRSLNGSTPTPMPSERVEACSRLYAVLPLTGGKVNAPNLWRKSLEDTLAFAWGAYMQLRTTYSGREFANIARPNSAGDDPVVAVPLALDRLRAAVAVINDLLRSNIARPVSLPIASLVRLCSALLQCSTEEKPEMHADHTVYALERSVIPTLWNLACTMLVSISRASRHHLTPHVPALVTSMAHHLEQPRTPSQILSCFKTTLSLLQNGAYLHDAVIASRLVRAILPRLSILLSSRSQSSTEDEQTPTQGRNRKGKKRARGYEGDEVFKVGREIICATAEEGNALLAAVDVLGAVLASSQASPPTHSLASRLVLSIYASLLHIPPANLSPDLSLHRTLHTKLQRLCMHLAIGTSSTASKSLGLILGVSDHMDEQDVLSRLDVLLHPRVPPLVRSLPHVEMLSLFRSEESQEEEDARKRAGLAIMNDGDVGEPRVASGSQPPHIVVPNAASSTPVHTLDAAKISGTALSRYADAVNMQVDVTPVAPPAAPPSRVPVPPISSTLPSQPPSVPTLAHRAPQTPLPPPPIPTPTNTAASGAPSTSSTVVPTAHVTPAAAAPVQDDDDDEPMPMIDLGSDSESE